MQFEERYKGACLRFSRDKTSGEIKDYPPFMRFNIPVAPDGLNFIMDGFFGQDRKPIQVTTSNANQMISRNDQCRCIIQVNSLWANQLGFGFKLKMLQIRVIKAALRLADVDRTGGDDEDDAMLVVEESDDPELAQANMHLQGMRRGAEAVASF